MVGSRRTLRDHAAHGDPWIPPTGRFSVDSGAGRGTELFQWDFPIDHNTVMSGNQKYNRYELSGSDAHLFNSRVYDDDNDSRNGYTADLITRRPLPVGVYRFTYHPYLYFYEPCGYHDNAEAREMIVTVTAPPGTVHEAFFDLATTTAGVGYLAGSATTTGVLKPVGFSVRGRAITITGLTWRDGRVVLTLDRFGSWLDGFSFIEPDGTVGLRLAEVDSTKDWTARTLTWEVSEQPWESGDELMLRMGPIPLPAVRNLTAEANSAGEVVLRWEVAYRAGVSGYRIWRHRPGRDDGPRIYVSDTLSTDTTYTDANSPVPNLTEYRVQAIDRVYNARGEFRACSVRQPVGGGGRRAVADEVVLCRVRGVGGDHRRGHVVGALGVLGGHARAGGRRADTDGNADDRGRRWPGG